MVHNLYQSNEIITMKLLDSLKLDSWWAILLYLGIALLMVSLITNVEFIEKKHLFGLGLGVFLIGFSYKMAEKYLNMREPGGILSTKIIKHTFPTIVLLILGLGLTVIFGGLIIKELI